MKNKKKVGELAYELLSKPEKNVSVIDQTRANLEAFEKNMFECAERGKQEHRGVFYIVVITKKERLMPNVLRNYFFHRTTCPTPDWDQSVYQYNPSDDAFVYLWSVPAKDVCEYLLHHKLVVDHTEHELLKNVLDFYNGKLLAKAQELNGEKKNSILLES